MNLLPYHWIACNNWGVYWIALFFNYNKIFKFQLRHIIHINENENVKIPTDGLEQTCRQTWTAKIFRYCCTNIITYFPSLTVNLLQHQPASKWTAYQIIRQMFFFLSVWSKQSWLLVQFCSLTLVFVKKKSAIVFIYLLRSTQKKIKKNKLFFRQKGRRRRRPSMRKH